MNFIQWHIGDWLASTSLMSPTERGVYMDLLMRYYKEERGITQEECTRIARAYAQSELDALEYILHTHFTLQDGLYIHARCEQEIAKSRTISETKRRASIARWSKKPDNSTSENEQSTSNAHDDARGDAHAVHGASICNPLTNNHKPIYINKEKEDKEKEISGSQAPAQTAPTEATVSKRQPIPYQKIQDLYNEVAGDKLPKAVSLNDKRKSDIAARVRELVKIRPIHSQDDLLRELRAVFTRLVSDPWYCGKNDRGWIASIDYIFSVKGFTKFLERPDDFRAHAPEQPKSPNQISRLPTPREFTAEELMGNITGN